MELDVSKLKCSREEVDLPARGLGNGQTHVGCTTLARKV